MIETSIVVTKTINVFFQTFLRDTTPKQTEIIPVNSKDTWAFNEGLCLAKGNIVVLIANAVELSQNWYDELIDLMAANVGAVAYNLKSPPSLIVISRECMEDTGQLDLDLAIEYSFLEYISRIIDHGWHIRFTPLSNNSSVFKTETNSNIDIGSSRRLVLKLLRHVFQEIPDAALNEVPSLASLLYERGCFKEALRWVARLALRNLSLAQKWWQNNFNEPGLSYEEFYELAEFLREDRVMERDLALGKMHLEQGRFELAAAHLASSLESNPYNPEPYYLLGEAARLQNLTDDAMLLYSQALKIKPDYIPAEKQLFLLSTRSLNDAQEPRKQPE